MTGYYILAAAAYLVPCAGATLGWAMIRRADRKSSGKFGRLPSTTSNRKGD